MTSVDPLRVLGLGVGVQSSALFLMALTGELPPFDCAIFADTQNESAATYAYLDYLRGLAGRGERGTTETVRLRRDAAMMTTASERHADAMTSSAARERPILMSAAMVLACLNDTKAQTRRVVKPQPPEGWERHCWFDAPVYGWTYQQIPAGDWHTVRCPYGGVGTRLWVRETFAIVPRTAYRASNGVVQTDRLDDPYDHDAAVYRAGWERTAPMWRPSIFMPRWASRLTLTITDLRVERVQDIGEADARAEGVASVAEYRELWDPLNAKRGYGWGVNPFVWVVSFARVRP